MKQVDRRTLNGLRQQLPRLSGGENGLFAKMGRKAAALFGGPGRKAGLGTPPVDADEGAHERGGLPMILVLGTVVLLIVSVGVGIYLHSRNDAPIIVPAQDRAAVATDTVVTAADVRPPPGVIDMETGTAAGSVQRPSRSNLNPFERAVALAQQLNLNPIRNGDVIIIPLADGRSFDLAMTMVSDLAGTLDRGTVGVLLDERLIQSVRDGLATFGLDACCTVRVRNHSEVIIEGSLPALFQPVLNIAIDRLSQALARNPGTSHLRIVLSVERLDGPQVRAVIFGSRPSLVTDQGRFSLGSALADRFIIESLGPDSARLTVYNRDTGDPETLIDLPFTADRELVLVREPSAPFKGTENSFVVPTTLSRELP